MLKNVDGRLSAFQRFQIWFGRYAFIFFSVSFLVLLIFSLLTAYIYYTEKSQREKLLSVIDRLSNYGIFITQDNRIVALEKTKVGNVLLRGAVKNAVVNDFVLSRVSFLDRNGSFVRVNPDRPKEFLSTLIKESDAVNNLWNYFVKDDRDSLKTFYLYTKYLYELARDGKLPDIIQPTSGVKVEYFVKEGKNTFRAKVKVPVIAAYYTASNEMRRGRGTITFELYGEVNPVKTARYYQKNPFGIIVKRVSVSYITVDSLRR